jgi:hypothetical protein
LQDLTIEIDVVSSQLCRGRATWGNGCRDWRSPCGRARIDREGHSFLLKGGESMRRTASQVLLGQLERNEMLKAKGYSFACAPTGGIVIDRAGHVHGVWDFDGGLYTWRSPGSSAAIFTTEDARAAVLYTLVALAQGSTRAG